MMKLYQNYEDGMTYYLGVDEENKLFTVSSEAGRHHRIGYIPVDSSGYRAAFEPVFADTLAYKCVPFNF